jgi:NAD(P)H-dependent flavin oxidoreductase YrpB (nitropropane dioxygenase family)
MTETGNLRTPLCAALGMPYPIIQSAMGWVATPQLVCASGRAGAFPFLAVATLTPAEAELEIATATENLGDAPFGVNFLMEQPGAAEIVESIIRHRVRAAGYSRSPNPALIGRLKENGVLCVATVGLPRHAEKAVQLGADVLIAQGAEGGGHTGPLATTQLVPLVARTVDVPVAAAGGFADGQGLVSALAMGAAGIAMGTRFLLTRESPVPERVKRYYLDAGVDSTVVSTRIDGIPQRVLRNDRVQKLESARTFARIGDSLRSAREYRKLSSASLVQLISGARALRKSDGAGALHAAHAAVLARRALVDGDVTDGVLPAGQVVGRISDLPSCDELVRRIVAEADATMNAMAN